MLVKGYIIDSSLNERTQNVSLNGISSDELEVICGIPLGTILGPVIFLLYMIDLFLSNSTGDIMSFADDIVIFYQDLQTG